MKLHHVRRKCFIHHIKYSIILIKEANVLQQRDQSEIQSCCIDFKKIFIIQKFQNIHFVLFLMRSTDVSTRILARQTV